MIASKTLYLSAGVSSGAVGIVAPGVTALDVLSGVMDAIGVGHLSGPSFVAGLAFSVAGAFIALSHTLPEDRLDKWATMSAAILISILMAIGQNWVGRHHIPSFHDIPPQLLMGAAGLFSRKAVDWTREPHSIIKALFGGKK